MEHSDTSDVGFRQLGSPMRSASRMATTTLPLHVVDIVGLRADEEMFNFNAETVVAGVTDAQSIGVFTAEQEPGKTMREPWTISEPNDPVAFVAPDCTNPNEASIFGALRFGKERFGGRGDTDSSVATPSFHGEHCTLYSEESQ